MNKSVKLLFYCTKAKPYLTRNVFSSNGNEFGLYSYKPIQYEKDISLNGKVVAEADCDLVENLKKYEYSFKDGHFYDVLEKACLTSKDLQKYCHVKIYEEPKDIYAIHLKNVKPFDEPKELSEYFNKKPLSYDDWLYGIYSGGKGAKSNYESYLNVFKLKKAPQNMCYLYDKNGNIIAVAISIQSPHLYNIMNGEKTIEVRTFILNALKELIKNDFN